MGSLGNTRQVVAQARYVALDRVVRVDAEGGRHLRVGLPPHGDLLTLADQHELALAGCGIHCAGSEARRDEGQKPGVIGLHRRTPTGMGCATKMGR
jgi:hypothetical protein